MLEPEPTFPLNVPIKIPSTLFLCDFCHFLSHFFSIFLNLLLRCFYSFTTINKSSFCIVRGSHKDLYRFTVTKKRAFEIKGCGDVTLHMCFQQLNSEQTRQPLFTTPHEYWRLQLIKWQQTTALGSSIQMEGPHSPRQEQARKPQLLSNQPRPGKKPDKHGAVPPANHAGAAASAEGWASICLGNKFPCRFPSCPSRSPHGSRTSTPFWAAKPAVTQACHRAQAKAEPLALPKPCLRCAQEKHLWAMQPCAELSETHQHRAIHWHQHTASITARCPGSRIGTDGGKSAQQWAGSGSTRARSVRKHWKLGHKTHDLRYRSREKMVHQNSWVWPSQVTAKFVSYTAGKSNKKAART